MILAAAFFITATVSAQAADAPAMPPAGALQGVTPEMMRQVMQNAQKVQTCIAKQQGAMEALRARHEEMNRTLDQLCAEGKEDEAKVAAQRYGKEMNNLPVVKALKRCGQAMEGGSPIPIDFMPEKPKAGSIPAGICDGRTKEH
jgi:hypothetical protein